jgi:hypothetical protein
VFLFQSLNEHVEGLRDFANTGVTPFAPNLSAITFADGVRLILRAADRVYYIQENAFSQGMYLSMLKEEAAGTPRQGEFMR